MRCRRSVLVSLLAFCTQTDGALRGALPDCLDLVKSRNISSWHYHWNDTVNINTTGAVIRTRGQCSNLFKTPGAYYTKSNKLIMDLDSVPPSLHSKPWQCWTDDQRADWRTDAKAIDLGYDGACTFSDYKNPMEPDEVHPCIGSHLPYLPYHPRDCGPGPQTYWGACISNISERWECIPKNDKAYVERMAKGDCKSQSVREDSAGNLYTDVCKFLPAVSKPYKCDDVETYTSGNGATCGSLLATYNHACFSETAGDVWQCFDETVPVANHTPCTWSMSGRGEFYDGLCLFPSNPGYKQAGEDPTAAPHPETTLTTTTIYVPPPPTPPPPPPPPPPPAPTPAPEASGLGAGPIVGIVFLILIILGVVAFLAMKSQGGGAARTPLVDGGAEMHSNARRGDRL